jgi:SAM-dependent methyltransferase
VADGSDRRIRGTLGHSLSNVPDAIFAERRLAEIYDPLDPDRGDLDLYLGVAAEFGARSVLDVGCGTGTFACLLAGSAGQGSAGQGSAGQDGGVDVTGVDPAAASLDVARTKPGADRVRWLHGDATRLPPLQVDLATMTANVAQVFLTDEDWSATLRGIHAALRPGGHLVFETRDPARQAWLDWNRAATYKRADIPGVGEVETWTDVTAVRGDYVSFRSTFVFASDQATLTSHSTLRFRSRAEIDASLAEAGYAVIDVRDAPDRPGREWIYIASRGLVCPGPT